MGGWVQIQKMGVLARAPLDEDHACFEVNMQTSSFGKAQCAASAGAENSMYAFLMRKLE